jgi:hypothetical protein
MGPEKRRHAAGSGARVSGHCASAQPARPQDNTDRQSDPPLVVLVETVDRRSRFRARLGDRIIVESSRQPFFDAARALITEGCDPAVMLIMRHAGAATDALIAKVGVAARLTIREDRGGPEFVPYHQMSLKLDVGTRQMRESSRQVPGQSGAAERTSGARVGGEGAHVEADAPHA